MADWFEKRTIGSLPAEAAARWGSREALRFQERRWSFAELSASIDDAARGLLVLGVEPGEKVLLWMVNRPEFIQTTYAVIKIGAVLIPLNTRFRTEDVAYVLGQSDSTTLVISERSGPIDYLAMLREVVPSLGTGHSELADPRFPMLRRVIVVGDGRHPGTVHWEDMCRAGAGGEDRELARRAEAASPDDTAFLLYTSGTTGFPKGVMHSHAIVRNVIDRASRMGITETDVIMNYLPLFHLYGFSEGLLMSMLTGACQVLTETFAPGEVLDLIRQEAATLLSGFDIHFKELCEAQERGPRDVSSVRTGILASGMSSSVPTARRARRVFGKPFLSGYGMSEFGVGATLSFLDSTEEQCVEASGYPAPGYEIRVVDPKTSRDRPRGEPGEILVRSYMLMQGYYQQSEETARTIDTDGWLQTGDMGILRTDGHLRFVGRYKDMLKIGGENVDPMEVEAYLMGHPAINLAAVVAYPDARLSEVGVAFVRLEPGQALTEEQVLDYCRGKIASFKIPRRVIFVDEYPMTSSGKIQKAKLREEALRGIPTP
jgi:fatty-acyl-CoA synthase